MLSHFSNTQHKAHRQWEKNLQLILYSKLCVKDNRTKRDTYSRQNVPKFESVDELRELLLANFAAEVSPAKTTSSFKVGYIVGADRRVASANDINLAEGYSLVKSGWITLWAEVISTSEGSLRGTKRPFSTANVPLTNPRDDGNNIRNAARSSTFNIKQYSTV